MTLLEKLKGYDTKKVKESLDMLITDRSNEFKELAHGMGIPTTAKNWEYTILKYCMDFNDCFPFMTSIESPNESTDEAHNRIHQCMTLIRQIARGKTNMIEITHLQNLAYTLAEEFKAIYKRLS